MAPQTIQDNMRWWFIERESSDPGPYTKENGYTGFTMMSLVHGGLIQPFNIHRANVPDRVHTDAMRSDRLIGDPNLDRAVWFNTGLDANGETTLFLHTAATNETYALHGTSAGFAAEGGTGQLADYAAASRVKLYQYVTDRTFIETGSLGIALEVGLVTRLVDGPDVRFSIPVAATVQDGQQVTLMNNGAVVATAVFENGQATLEVANSDVSPQSNYAIVAQDGSAILGVVPIAAHDIVSAKPAGR